MSQSSVKSEFRTIIDSLPDTATWDDVLREAFVRALLSEGVSDAEARQSYSEAAVRKWLFKAAS
ncbi:MAG: hypothetical protein M3P27_04430 [Acidobacteriota bacterium]|nr:hypothetical protein [Acidobacteriota bacterium]